MPTPYDGMWEKLNLDLTAHEGLLQVLGKFYGDIYLTQEGRLKGMEYLDFVLSEVHGLRIKELQDAKARGKKVIGKPSASSSRKSWSWPRTAFTWACAPAPKSAKKLPRRFCPGTLAP